MSQGIDVDTLRAETPGCANVAHLNNAGAALPPRPVTDAVIGHLELEARIGGYEAYDQAQESAERFYDAIAALIGAGRDEIAFAENATRAWDMAFYALPFAPGDRILTTTSEYASNGIAYIQAARRHQAIVEVLPDDEDGQLSLSALAAELDRGGVRLVAINHVPTHNGLVNPAEEVGALCRAAGVPFLLDACQSVGQFPVDVGAIGCDMLSVTGRKFLRGPRGTGFLYVRRDFAASLEPPFLDLHSATWTGPGRYDVRADGRRFETWERNVAGQIGLAVAADYAAKVGLAAIGGRVTELADGLRADLADLAGVKVLDRGRRRCGIVTFDVSGHEAGAVKTALRGVGVNVSATDIAHQRMDPYALPSAVRASVHYYNTRAELDLLVRSVAELG
ncbi:aminotransferase class V-fold PLP-dependent enzyme [Spongiactinospora sp. TRM90649]|uniref:aminotransferase class V-fold PLP-dependent enzyme n=1 Tax=Spongiactinospora sp. TRM90649 TaxID=3031114 RepID=UPI0023F96C15|nr:aminotransferase class V-fold PLP-dependent enzyme [Spongiactinospora sp. TRM90649]MDF5756544.1 aminotransferase class V-fold PLP-dependent enzyme [Spongiactinospora sp. TRM90649]